MKTALRGLEVDQEYHQIFDDVWDETLMTLGTLHLMRLREITGTRVSGARRELISSKHGGHQPSTHQIASKAYSDL